MSHSADNMRPAICQIGIVSTNAERSIHFYRALLGFEQTGHLPVRGKTAARLMGEPFVDGTHYWLAGEEDFFQFEVFQFNAPRQLLEERRPRDYGYHRIVIVVSDLDAILAELPRWGAMVHQAPVMQSVGTRCTYVQDPDGILIELVECSSIVSRARIVGIAATVKNVEETRQYFQTVLGMTERKAIGLNGKFPEDAAFNGNLSDKLRASVTLEAGPYWLELSEYYMNDSEKLPRRCKLTEQGIMNVAFGVRKSAEFKKLFLDSLRYGCRSATLPITDGFSNSAYLDVASVLSIELLQLPPFYDALWGFKPPGFLARMFQGIIRFFLKLL